MNIKHLHEIDSTNRYLHDLQDSLPDGITAVRADFQTAGRGCGSNTWESEAGQNLLFSILLKPVEVAPAKQFLLSMVEALAVKKALDSLVDGICLKWPNDIYWHDKKLGGTLIETTLGQKEIKTCIFGTGLNVNQIAFQSDAPNPVSLRQILGHAVDVESLFLRVLQCFEDCYGRLLSDGETETINAYHAALYRAQGMHDFSDAEGRFRAKIEHVEPDGRIVLCDENGRLRTYAFKELRFEMDENQQEK